MKMSAMKLKKTLIYLFLAVFTFVQIFPFYWLVTFSFKSNTEIFDSNNLVGLPKVWHFGNYSKALMGGEILRYLLNSVFYAAVTVVVSTLLASMVAYAINRMYWKAKGIVAAIFSLGIMIPVQAASTVSGTGSTGNQRRISGTDASVYYICHADDGYDIKRILQSSAKRDRRGCMY